VAREAGDVGSVGLGALREQVADRRHGRAGEQPGEQENRHGKDEQAVSSHRNYPQRNADDVFTRLNQDGLKNQI
jgi:hypothetical protein